MLLVLSFLYAGRVIFLELLCFPILLAPNAGLYFIAFLNLLINDPPVLMMGSGFSNNPFLITSAQLRLSLLGAVGSLSRLANFPLC